MIKVLDYGLEVSEFIFQSRYDIYFRTNTLQKCMSSFILPAKS